MGYARASTHADRTGSIQTGEIAVQTRVKPFLMFEGKAEEAMSFYVSLFRDGEIIDIVRYGPGQRALKDR
jgi:3-demethylubiquinone-9 3-methyltransferase